jgi:hypothetical protein
LLIEHKEAVIRVLEALDQLEGAGEAERPGPG